MPNPTNDNRLPWELLVKEDGVYLALGREDSAELVNLGSEAEVSEALADWLAERGVGE